MLFGASRADVLARMALVQPRSHRRIPDADGPSRARQARIDYLLLTDRDPVWRAVAQRPCRYRTRRVCILAAKDIVP
ncbi:MAG: hypothetical protein AB7E60_07425 [Sphingobium sp.]